MKKVRAFALVLLAFPLGVGVSVATSGHDHPGDGLPGCKPSHNTPQKCRTTSTVTVTTPGTTTTVTQPGTTTTVTVPAPPTPPPTVIVTQGPTSTTVNITITINGVPTTVTVPGSMPGSKPNCVNTRKAAILGPLPRRFTKGTRVSITSFGHSQSQRVGTNHKVFVNLSNVPCGVFPMVIRRVPSKPGFKPALRIWSLTGGNGLRRFWFPGILGVST